MPTINRRKDDEGMDKGTVKNNTETSTNQLSRFFEDDMFTDPFGLIRTSRIASMLRFPKVDIHETENEVRITAEIPGVNPDDVEIDVKENSVIITGHTEREMRTDERPYRYERSYGSFRREIRLPARVRKDDAKASCKNGVLEITLPISESEKYKKLTIEKE